VAVVTQVRILVTARSLRFFYLDFISFQIFSFPPILLTRHFLNCVVHLYLNFSKMSTAGN
jgi:hypothetical protein